MIQMTVSNKSKNKTPPQAGFSMKNESRIRILLIVNNPNL